MSKRQQPKDTKPSRAASASASAKSPGKKRAAKEAPASSSGRRRITEKYKSQVFWDDLIEIGLV